MRCGHDQLIREEPLRPLRLDALVAIALIPVVLLAAFGARTPPQAGLTVRPPGGVMFIEGVPDTASSAILLKLNRDGELEIDGVAFTMPELTNRLKQHPAQNVGGTVILQVQRRTGMSHVIQAMDTIRQLDAQALIYLSSVE